MTVVEVHEPGCDCSGCIRAEAIGRPWRCGSQVGRTVYVDAGWKSPDFLLGVMDTPELAAHVVQAHNALSDGRIAGQEAENA